MKKYKKDWRSLTMDSKNDFKKIDLYSEKIKKYDGVSLHALLIIMLLFFCGLLMIRDNFVGGLLVMFGLGSSYTLFVFYCLMGDMYRKKLKVLIKGGQDGKK